MTQQTKAYRRDKLKRLVEAGRVEAVDSYHFDDMHGAGKGLDGPKPVVMKSGTEPFRDGVVYLWPSDFRTKSGCCWENPNGTVTLVVHGNCNYTFRIKEAA